SNIIWNASDDYSFQPEIKAYDEGGKADIYWNYIIGAVYKYYDYSLLQSFFSCMKEDSNFTFYENLTWLGLENCAYKKGKDERLVLESLRNIYAKKVLSKVDETSDFEVFDKIKTAHFQRVLGEEPNITGDVLNILNDLEFDESINTEQIILRMNEIFKVYFKFSPSQNEENSLKKIVRNRKIIHFGGKKQHYSGSSLLKRIDIGSSEFSDEPNFDNNKEKKNKITFQWLKFKGQRDKNQREYIQDYFGTSILAGPQTRALEQIMCTGNHKNCHLHFTRGKFEHNMQAEENITVQEKVALWQKEKNNKYYKDNLARNNNSITKLTNKIRNTMLLNLEKSANKSKMGNLITEKVWRNIYLQDNNIFMQSAQNDIGNLSVDILLDASASQLCRQEIIATEAYIIAQSITRCNVPLKVYSFCNLRDYTIINLFRDYGEIHKNNNILNYNAAGYNRDGLAIRTALHLIKNSSCENKILIVLSDGKPNDIQNISTSSLIPANHEYADDQAVNDTAQEVRKGRENGVSILGVFTGNDEDVPAAKKIYGRNFARINSPEKFADIVGVLMHNELESLR
ncbi:MAG: hypothetical protein WBJ13_10035, partial [Sedimentibacter sp.]